MNTVSYTHLDVYKRQEENKETGIIKVAKPKGVVGAVTPVTNPVVTPMCNAMFALKGKNAIVIAPHPRTSDLNKYVVDLFRAELKKLGLPEDLIQTIEHPSLDMTQEVMKTADVVVATGGAGMVKSAYSSGKPALGVGPVSYTHLSHFLCCMKRSRIIWSGGSS